MRNYKIIRNEVGRFILRYEYGNPLDRKIVDVELAMTADASKLLLQDYMSRVQVQFLPLSTRDELLASITDDMPKGKKPIFVANQMDARPMAPDSPDYEPITINIPNSI